MGRPLPQGEGECSRVPCYAGTGRARWLYSSLARRRLLLRRHRRWIPGQIRAHRHAPLHPRPGAELLEPALEVLELLDVLALRLPVHRPRIADHVGDRVLVAGQVAALVQPVVQHPEQPVGLVGEAGHRVGLVALGVAQPAEVTAFAALRPLVGHLPDQPLDDLMLRPRRLREELPFLFGDIHHDRAGIRRWRSARRRRPGCDPPVPACGDSGSS